MRKPLALMTIAVLSLALSACGGSGPAKVKPSSTPQPTASAIPSATPTAKLAQPSRTRPLVALTDQAILAYCPDLPAVHFDGKAANVTKATICTSVPSSNSGTMESASWVNFGLDALLSAYGAPNQPVTKESCTRVTKDPLLVWLTTTEGTLYPVYAPVDKCGYPSAAAIDAYQSAGLQILYEADLDANGQPVNPQ